MTNANSRRVLALMAMAGVVIMLVGLFGATTTSALPDYTSKTGQACGVCHVNPAGGGALTARGTAFAAIATHTSDPAGAFTQSGAAAPAATPTAAAKPAASPTAAATAAPAASPTAAPKPAATATATATPGALPRTGGEPIAPMLAGGGAFLAVLGFGLRRLLRR